MNVFPFLYGMLSLTFPIWWKERKALEKLGQTPLPNLWSPIPSCVNYPFFPIFKF